MGNPLLWSFRNSAVKSLFVSLFPSAAKRLWGKTSGEGISHWHGPLSTGFAPMVESRGNSKPPEAGRDTVTFLAPSASAFFRAASKSSFCPMLAWKAGNHQDFV